jgi:coenzyme PQQ precursor peptide PqqA
MTWITPGFEEVSLGCEINSYASAPTSANQYISHTTTFSTPTVFNGQVYTAGGCCVRAVHQRAERAMPALKEDA